MGPGDYNPKLPQDIQRAVPAQRNVKSQGNKRTHLAASAKPVNM